MNIKSLFKYGGTRKRSKRRKSKTRKGGSGGLRRVGGSGGERRN
jgi:hypothetical protein